MIQRLLAYLGLHIDQQSLSTFWSKVLSIAALVVHGAFDIPTQLTKLGVPSWNHESAQIYAICAVILYFAAHRTDSSYKPSPDLSMRLAVIWLMAALGAGLLVSACSGLKKPVDPAVIAQQIAAKTNPVEHAIQPLQDLEIQAERAALVLAPDVATRDRILTAHITIQQDIKQLSTDVRHVAEVAVGVSTDPLPLAQLLVNLTSEVQPIANDIETQFGVSAPTRTAIGAAATVISAAIASIATS